MLREFYWQKHREAFESILDEFRKLEYNVSYFLLNTYDYGVSQDRKRVIIVGYHQKLNKTFTPPKPLLPRPNLQEIIADLPEAKPALDKNYANKKEDLLFANHEYFVGGFSSIFMSRTRIRNWDEPSFTTQAGARYTPLHPQTPKMQLIEQNKRVFVKSQEHLYRRLSVRKCARIQSFPDDFVFKYKNVSNGYKMIGNAVAVNFATAIAKKFTMIFIWKLINLFLFSIFLTNILRPPFFPKNSNFC